MQPDRIGSRPTEHRDVEHAATAADEALARWGIVEPAETKATGRPACPRHIVVLHERLEQLTRRSGFLQAILPVGFERYAACRIDRDELADGKAQCKALNVAPAQLRQQQRGIQRRCHAFDVLDRNQYRFHPVAPGLTVDDDLDCSILISSPTVATSTLDNFCL